MANSSNTPCLSSIHASSLHVGIPDLVDILDHSDTAMNSREQLLTEMVSNLQQRFKKDHIYVSSWLWGIMNVEKCSGLPLALTDIYWQHFAIPEPVSEGAALQSRCH